jgi:Beta-propeller repeat
MDVEQFTSEGQMDSRLTRLSITVLISGLVFMVTPANCSAASRSSGTAVFTKNIGQWPDSILLRSSANGATMWFTKNGIWYQFFRTTPRTDDSLGLSVGGRRPRLPQDTQPDSIETTMIKAEFVGSSESVEVVGLEELEYKCNYFIGNEPTKWHTDVPNYSAVTMRGLYSGVDVSFTAESGGMHAKFTAVSESQLSQVQVEYRGGDGATMQAGATSLVHSAFGKKVFDGILLVGESASKSEPQVRSAASGASGVSLVYSTYLGGNGDNEYSLAIAVDSGGNAYVTGLTSSANFPTQNPLQVSYGGGVFDAFVTKLSGTGSELIYSTYIGGSNEDYGLGIAVDAGGNTYVTGVNVSVDFPTLNPYQATHGGGIVDAFVTKLSSDGRKLIYSTYLGGSSDEYGSDIAVDSGDNAYVTGQTGSANFPTENPYQDSYGGSSWDAFVTKFNSAGSDLTFSTYLGGSNVDECLGVAVDASGNAYVTGYTESADFPTQNPFYSTGGGANGTNDAFVTKLNSVGNALVFSTYLGGSSVDVGYDIAVDSGGNAFVTGYTYSVDFLTHNPFQDSYSGTYDAFIAKLNSNGSALIYSTYLGGNSDDWGNGIAIDVSGSAYVTGLTNSANFPTQNSFNASNGGATGTNDAFVTKINSAGSALIYSTYLGGSSYDNGNAIAVDASGNAYVTGQTTSVDFPTQDTNYASHGGGDHWDAFITKLVAYSCCRGIRGNVEGDVGEGVNVGDVTFLVQYLFQAGAAPPCMEEADVFVTNSINIVDLTTLVNYLFSGGPVLPACP